MKLTLQVMVVIDDGQGKTREITAIERKELQLDTVGLTVAEGKTILKRLQAIVLEQQVQEFLVTQRRCPDCGKVRPSKGNDTTTLRTVFGKLQVRSPRLYHCSCRPRAQHTFRPLATRLPERTTPELLYLETKFASLLSYGVSTQLLRDVLPIDDTLNPVTIRNHLFKVADRAERALGEEQLCFTEGCPRDWGRLPAPSGPLTVGIDGGFVRWRRQRARLAVISESRG